MSYRMRATRYANHPIVKYVRSLPEELHLGREVAETLNCSIATLAYLRRSSPTPMGAAHRAQYGGIVIHLYTPVRIAEIAEYMNEVSGVERGLKRRGPPALWTSSETYQRRRGFRRARTYRARAVLYREQGEAAQAAELDQRATVLTDELEAVRLQRRSQSR